MKAFHDMYVHEMGHTVISGGYLIGVSAASSISGKFLVQWANSRGVEVMA